jgi:hypothetical protein
VPQSVLPSTAPEAYAAVVDVLTTVYTGCWLFGFFLSPLTQLISILRGQSIKLGELANSKEKFGE